jgi:hypothetical protein
MMIYTPARDASLNRCRAGAQPNRPISGHRYTRSLPLGAVLVS